MPKETEKPKLQFYTVKMEVMAPVILTYKVLAESPERALQKVNTSGVIRPPEPVMSRARKLKATVYKYGMLGVEFIKNF